MEQESSNTLIETLKKEVKWLENRKRQLDQMRNREDWEERYGRNYSSLESNLLNVRFQLGCEEVKRDLSEKIGSSKMRTYLEEYGRSLLAKKKIDPSNMAAITEEEDIMEDALRITTNVWKVHKMPHTKTLEYYDAVVLILRREKQELCKEEEVTTPSFHEEESLEEEVTTPSFHEEESLEEEVVPPSSVCEEEVQEEATSLEGEEELQEGESQENESEEDLPYGWIPLDEDEAEEELEIEGEEVPSDEEGSVGLPWWEAFPQGEEEEEVPTMEQGGYQVDWDGEEEDQAYDDDYEVHYDYGYHGESDEDECLGRDYEGNYVFDPGIIMKLTRIRDESFSRGGE